MMSSDGLNLVMTTNRRTNKRTNDVFFFGWMNEWLVNSGGVRVQHLRRGWFFIVLGGLFNEECICWQAGRQRVADSRRG